MEADRNQALPVGRQDTTKVQPQNKSENPGIMILSFDITVKTQWLLTRVLTDSSEWLLDRGRYQFLFLRSAQTPLCPFSQVTHGWCGGQSADFMWLNTDE